MLSKNSKQDLNEFLHEIKVSIDELKRPCETSEQLAKNMKLRKDVMAKKEELKARILPIKQKFAYLQSDENAEFTNIELTEEEKESLNSIDEAWKRFEIGLSEAHNII